MRGNKMKVALFDKKVFKTFGRITTWTLAIFSVFAIFVPLTEKCKWPVFAFLIIIHIMILLGVYIYCNVKKKVTIKIRKTKIIIKEGDLFTEPGKKVIAFNEYFDTQVDDIVIAKNSLNGIFIKKHIKNIQRFDAHINDYLLHNKKPNFVDSKRLGKQIRYELGTIVPYNNFFLLAYSRFDENNCAYLERDDIAKLYLKMWDEIDILKACDSVCIPVLGSSGIVRKIDYTPQQLLELLLWSFRISGINMTRLASITIVVHRTMVDSIDFLKLKNFSD